MKLYNKGWGKDWYRLEDTLEDNVIIAQDTMDLDG